MQNFLWLIPFFPLLGFTILSLTGRRLGEPASGWIATLMVGTSFISAVALFAGLITNDSAQRVYELNLFEWIPSGELSVSMGFLGDPLSITMVLFITGVSTLIHIYAIGYMHGDPNFSKFFSIVTVKQIIFLTFYVYMSFFEC